MALLVNGDFEGGFTHRGAPELYVADGWVPWWHQTDTRPEYKRATPDVDASRIHSGEAAQQWFNSYATHTAGIYQRVVGMGAGAPLTFSAWVQCFSRNDDTDFHHSNGRYRMRIGIDPYGGTDPECPDIAWSDAVQPYDAYQQLTVTTVAKSDRCTVFVWGQAEWRLKHNNAYVDDVVLTIGDAPGPEPEPEPEPGEPSGNYVTPEGARAIARSVFKEMAMDGIALLVNWLTE